MKYWIDWYKAAKDWNRNQSGGNRKQSIFSEEIDEILGFFNFLTKTSEQHKGRLLVVVSFFVYFRRVSSLTETSSGNEYN